MYISLLLNYFKTSIRNIIRNKYFSAINIFGLALSMSFSILMITYLAGLLNFDDFHDNKNRIFKVYTKYTSLTRGDVMNLSSASPYVGYRLLNDYPGIEDVLTVKGGVNQYFQHGEDVFLLSGLYATKNFFSFFSFDLIIGNPANALSSINSVIISESTTEKYFQGNDPTGEILTYADKEYIITGVFADPPGNTHFGDFDVIISSSNSVAEAESMNRRQWSNIWTDHIYILAKENSTIESISSSVTDIANSENRERKDVKIEPYLKRLTDIVPGDGQLNKIGVTTDWKDLTQLIILSAVLLLIGCFNYTNLSLALSLKRVREVGVRKVFGAHNPNILIQFIIEAIMVSTLALMIAYPLHLFFRPFFIQEVLKESDAVFYADNKSVLWLVLFAISLGMLAGVIPALKLAKLEIIMSLKGLRDKVVSRWITSKKLIITVQFSVAMILVFSALISYRQFEYASNYDFGYKTDNVLNIPLYDKNVDQEVFKSEIEKIPGVQKISSSQIVPGLFAMNMANLVSDRDTIEFLYNKIDNNYLSLHEIEFLAGDGEWRNRNDSLAYSVIDQNLCRDLGFEKPQDAVGQVVYFPSDKIKLYISGVLKNYQYSNLELSSSPSALIQNFKAKGNYLNVLVDGASSSGIKDNIERIWQDLGAIQPFRAQFYDFQIEESYSEYRKISRIFTFLSALVIIISMVGLAGMIVLSTESRMKELNIRKVVGASRKSVVLLFAREYVVMLIIATIISVLTTLYIVDSFILTNFRSRVELGIDKFVPGILLIFLIVLTIISWQTIRASNSNPANGLRND